MNVLERIKWVEKINKITQSIINREYEDKIALFGVIEQEFSREEMLATTVEYFDLVTALSVASKIHEEEEQKDIERMYR